MTTTNDVNAVPEIMLGEIEQGSPESLLYVLGRQLETLTGIQRLNVVRQLQRLAEWAEKQPEHAEALQHESDLLSALGYPRTQAATKPKPPVSKNLKLPQRPNLSDLLVQAEILTGKRCFDGFPACEDAFCNDRRNHESYGRPGHSWNGNPE